MCVGLFIGKNTVRNGAEVPPGNRITENTNGPGGRMSDRLADLLVDIITSASELTCDALNGLEDKDRRDRLDKAAQAKLGARP